MKKTKHFDVIEHGLRMNRHPRYDTTHFSLKNRRRTALSANILHLYLFRTTIYVSRQAPRRRLGNSFTLFRGA